MSESRLLPVPDGLEGVRADAGIARLLGFSRSFAAEVIDAGGVRVNGAVVDKSHRLAAGDLLEVEWTPRQEPTVVAAEVPGLSIVHEDEDLVVVDKPPGVVAHPALGWDGPTVLGALAAAGIAVSRLGPVERAGIVHRLDAGTSGLMVVAKSDRAYTELKRMFHDREVDKIYQALAQGHPDPSSGTIDAPIGRQPGAEWKFGITAEGKHAVTHYETIEAFPYASLLRIKLETGRTHQIRVHFAAQRHPLAGDALYGADPVLAARLGLSRQWLHAVELSFRHPGTGREVSFSSPPAPDLVAALEILAGE